MTNLMEPTDVHTGSKLVCVDNTNRSDLVAGEIYTVHAYDAVQNLVVLEGIKDVCTLTRFKQKWSDTCQMQHIPTNDMVYILECRAGEKPGHANTLVSYRVVKGDKYGFPTHKECMHFIAHTLYGSANYLDEIDVDVKVRISGLAKALCSSHVYESDPRGLLYFSWHGVDRNDLGY